MSVFDRESSPVDRRELDETARHDTGDRREVALAKHALADPVRGVEQAALDIELAARVFELVVALLQRLVGVFELARRRPNREWPGQRPPDPGHDRRSLRNRDVIASTSRQFADP